MQYIKSFISVFFIAILPFFIACTSQDEKALDIQPSSKGDVGEVILVADSLFWAEEIGDSLRSILQSGMPGILQPESEFTVRYVRPYRFKGLLREHRNILLVTTFDKPTRGNKIMQKFFTPESKQRILQDENLFLIPQEDQFAKDQLLLQIFAADQRQLVEKLSAPENQQRIKDLLNQRELVRIQKRLFEEKGTLNTEYMQRMKEKHGFSLNIPNSYRLVKDTTGFVRLRYVEAKYDKNLIIAYKDYESEEQFTDEAILQWKTEIGKEFLAEPENPNWYVDTERQVPVEFTLTNVRGAYAKRVRGCWRLQERFVGGSYVSFVVTGNGTQRIYYLEGLLDAPGQNKREPLRELAAILSTFKG